jgi:hypothetical protein
MKELDNEMIEELRYFESINGNFTYNFVKEFIENYSSWENTDGVEGCLLDNYFVPLESKEIFGVGFIEKYVNPNMSEYRVEVYDNVQKYDEAYNRTEIERLECVVNKEDGEKSTVNYLVEMLKEGVAPISLEEELNNLDYLDSYDNDCLYLQLVELKEGNFKDLVIKALDEYINILRNRAEEDKKIIVNAQYDFEMSDFLDSFNKYYKMLYDGKITREKALKALDYFDESMTDKQKKLLDNFSIYRQDFIASDRECEAFVLTLNEFNYGFYTAFKG